MPELPEVEVCRQGLLPHLSGRIIDQAIIRFPRLRAEIPPELPARIAGRRLHTILRRGKYLLFDCRSETASNGPAQAWLMIHLGMSGSLRLLAPQMPLNKHAHFDLCCGETVLRYTDPRRFGVIDWLECETPWQHRLLCVLGVEPLEDDFTPQRLFALLHTRRTPVKQVLMDAHLIVGIGNIYAAESLFRAGISPLRPAHLVTIAETERLHAAIQQVLRAAIAAGGSSLRDYVHSDGTSGYFQIECAVYDRANLPCQRCGATLQQIRQAGRSTVYCPACQT
jgi:formamidopyrimidine-DNA glycosylase